MKTFRFALVFVLCLELMTSPVLAAGPSVLPGELAPTTGGGNEFVSGNYPGAILMPVNLWGAIQKPGIHHIPTQTDLVTLLSLAGGPSSEALLEKVLIKRRTTVEEQIIRVDIEDILEKPGVRPPMLEPNDIIIVPRERPTVSQNTMTTVSFIGGMLGIILAGFALSKQSK